jgi:DNA modification methylase
MTDITWQNATIRLGEIQPWQHNPRQSSKKTAAELSNTLDEFGQPLPFILGPCADGKYPLYDGHQRYAAWLAKFGASFEVFAVVASRPLTDTERRKYVIKFHAVAVGQWSDDVLSSWDASQVTSWGVDNALLKGWQSDINTFKELLKSEQPSADAEPQTDRAAELLEKWGVQPGDLWQIGEHRLICGDCTDAATVARVMGGEKADIAFTSPPYNLGKNIEISNRSESMKGKGSVYDGNQDDLGGGEYLGLLSGFTRIALHNSSYVLVNVQQLAGNKVAVIEYLYEMKDYFADVAIWHKTNQQPAMAENVMNSTFEYIFFFSSEVGPTRAIKTANFRGTFDNLYSSTINVNEFADVHGAAFPLKFAEHFIGAFCQSVCYEPFSGTGTTLVACENLGRKCRAVEISPAYVAVALERMSQAHPHLAIVRLDAGG